MKIERLLDIFLCFVFGACFAGLVRGCTADAAPQPTRTLVVKDVHGKVVGRLAGAATSYVANLESLEGALIIRLVPAGALALPVSSTGFTPTIQPPPGPYLYYVGPGCTGQAYVLATQDLPAPVVLPSFVWQATIYYGAPVTTIATIASLEALQGVACVGAGLGAGPEGGCCYTPPEGPVAGDILAGPLVKLPIATLNLVAPFRLE